MQSRLILLASTVALSALGGCAKLHDDLVNVSYGVAAAPLYAEDKRPTVATTVDIWNLVISSKEKCNKFVDGLVATETGTDTGLDLLTTLSSGLATVFTPLSTTHALSAAASVTGGWRTAIDSDVFAKASIASFTQAIQSTYYKDIGTFTDDLKTKADPLKAADAEYELSYLLNVHAECSLGAAQASINASLKANAPNSNPPPPGQNGTLPNSTGVAPNQPVISSPRPPIPGHGVNQ